jgi:hypothetical protein
MAAATYGDLHVPLTLSKLVSSPLDSLTSETLPVTLPQPARMSWSSKVTCLTLDAASSLLGVGGEITADAFVDAKLVGRVGEVIMEQLADISKIKSIPEPEDADAAAEVKPAKPTPQQSMVHSAIICLANFSRSEGGSAALLERDALLTALIKAFLDAPRTRCDFDEFAHVGTILMNLGQITAGQKILLNMSTSYLPKLLPFLQSPSTVRRYGVAGAIKNVCFDKDSSFYLIDQLDIIKPLCYPLCGPEGFELDDKQGMDISWWIEGEQKVREEDAGTRQMLVEAILLLCAHGRRAREIMRKKKVYEVIKVMDLSEESEEISEKISECVNFLMRDEEGTPERPLAMMIENGDAAKSGVIRSETNYDDVD